MREDRYCLCGWEDTIHKIERHEEREYIERHQEREKMIQEILGQENKD